MMNDSSLRAAFSKSWLAKCSLQLVLVLFFAGSLQACGNLINKQNSSPLTQDPSKPTVAVPDDPDDRSASAPTPTPAPTSPTSPSKPCHRILEQDGVYYEEQDDGQGETVEVPQFYSAKEEADFWRQKGGDCGSPPIPKPGSSPKPNPKPNPGATPVPSPADPAKPSSSPSYYCKPDASGNFDSNTTIIIGGNASDATNGGYVFGQGGGCINRPLREVWAVAMNNSLLTWDGTSDSSSDITPPLGVTKAFDVQYSVTRRYLGVPFTVKWEMNWFHILQKGTSQNPEKILINYHRYHGTTHIPYWEGSIVIQKVTDQITGVYIRNQINADQTGVEDAKSGATQIIQKYRTGAPAWNELP